VEGKSEKKRASAFMKIFFSQPDKRISDLESQIKEVQEWKKRVQGRLQVQ